MTGKMFEANQQTVILHPFHIGGYFGGYIVPAITKRTIADHRISGVVIYICNRGKVNVHAQSFKIIANLLAHLIDQVVVLDRPQSHLIRVRNRAVETHPQTPFGIHRN